VITQLKFGIYVFIVIGAVIMVVGFLGCCGAIRESQCLLATFFVFLFIIFSVLVAVGIYFAIKPEEFKTKVSEEFEEKYKEKVQSYSTGDEDTMKVVNEIHRLYNCCGYSAGLADFGVNPNAYPEVCKTSSPKEPAQLCPKAFSEKTGEAAKNRAVVLAGVALGIGLVMLLGMIFSMMLCCAIRDGM
jgi:CD9 antigen